MSQHEGLSQVNNKMENQIERLMVP